MTSTKVVIGQVSIPLYISTYRVILIPIRKKARVLQLLGEFICAWTRCPFVGDNILIACVVHRKFLIYIFWNLWYGVPVAWKCRNMVPQVTSSKESLLGYCHQYRNSTSTDSSDLICFRLANLSISRIGSFEKLLWIRMLDLSHNNLQSVEGNPLSWTLYIICSDVWPEFHFELPLRKKKLLHILYYYKFVIIYKYTCQCIYMAGWIPKQE